MISFLFRVVDRNPVHVRVGVWAGPRKGSRGKSGELVFRVDEWDRLREMLVVYPNVDLEETAAVPA